MAKNASAIKALEKALKQLQKTETPGRPAAKAAKESGSDNGAVLKESRRFAQAYKGSLEAESKRVEDFISTLDAIEAGTYTPRRGGAPKGTRRPRKAAVAANEGGENAG